MKWYEARLNLLIVNPYIDNYGLVIKIKGKATLICELSLLLRVTFLISPLLVVSILLAKLTAISNYDMNREVFHSSTVIGWVESMFHWAPLFFKFNLFVNFVDSKFFDPDKVMPMHMVVYLIGFMQECNGYRWNRHLCVFKDRLYSYGQGCMCNFKLHEVHFMH